MKLNWNTSRRRVGKTRAEARAGARAATCRRRSPFKLVKRPPPLSAEEFPAPALVPREPEPIALSPSERQPYDGNTAFNLYLREVGQTKLLTVPEENQLAARIKKGDKRARERMIKANLRLVVKIAREYEDYGMPLLDLINEGNMGLMKAVERFDPAKGAKLSTYSSWWIKQAIKRALANQSKTIRLPVHVVDKLFHMRRASLKLQEVLGREPTDEELGDELGLSARKVNQLRAAAIRPASLEAPLGDDDSGQIADVVRDENADTPHAKQLEEKANTTAHAPRDVVAGTGHPRSGEILPLSFRPLRRREREDARRSRYRKFKVTAVNASGRFKTGPWQNSPPQSKNWKPSARSRSASRRKPVRSSDCGVGWNAAGAKPSRNEAIPAASLRRFCAVGVSIGADCRLPGKFKPGTRSASNGFCLLKRLTPSMLKPMTRPFLSTRSMTASCLVSFS